MPQRFDCVVYAGPSQWDDDEDDENWLGDLYTPVVEIARWTAIADSPREAAGRAWERTLGRARVRKLRDLDAPEVIIEHESDPRQIAREMTTAKIWAGECFKLDNMVQTWYVVVAPAQGAGDQEANERHKHYGE